MTEYDAYEKLKEAIDLLVGYEGDLKDIKADLVIIQTKMEKLL